jgi:hypothetical protein
MSGPRLHHYVPQFYLKRFVDNTGLICIWDKSTRKIFRTTPNRVAAQTHFYRIPEFIGTNVDPLILERDLAILEGRASRIIGTIVLCLPSLQPLDKVTLTEDERRELSFFLAVQFLRSAEQRETLALFAVESGSYKELPSDEERTNLHAQMLYTSGLVEMITDRLMNSIWVYARNETPLPFWTSDNPVAFKTGNNQMWLKGPGILEKGSYIVFPLTPKHVLYCKEPEHWAAARAFDSCLSPVKLSVDMVKHENAGQVFMATRHVISSSDDFAWANEFAESIGTDMFAPRD